MSKVGLACAAIGAIAALVSAVVGIIFINNREFVVATIQCNITQPGSAGNSSNCVDNALVDPVSGEVCQVGRLGLLQADYTPECTAGQVGYDLTDSPAPLNANFTTDTKEFGILFPAQTNFAGLLENVPGFDLEFQSCDTYFASSELQEAFGALGTASAQDGFEAFANNFLPDVQAGFPDVIGSLANQSFATACTQAYSQLSGLVSAFGLAPPSNVSAEYGAFPNYFAAFTDLSAVPAQFQLQVGGFGLTLSNTFTNVGGSITDPATLFSLGCNAGYTGQDGLPREGLFSPMGSAVLCGGSTCTYAEFIMGSTAEALEAFQLLLNRFRDGFNAAPESALVKPFFGGQDLSFSDFGVIVANRSSNLIFGQVFAAALERDVFWVNLASGLTAPDLLPSDFDASLGPTDLLSGACTVNPFNLSAGCSFLELTNRARLLALGALSLVPPSATILLFEAQERVDGLQTLVNLMNGCKLFNVTTISGCLVAVAPSLTNLAAETIFGTFYGTDDGQTFAEYAETATANCLDDEKDIAALSQAQTLVPPGVYLGFVAAVGVALSAVLVVLGKGGKAAPAVALVSGILALVGVALIIVALLGILNAPIYASVGGGSGPIEDNTQLRAQGPGAVLVYIVLGAGIVGIVSIFAAAAALFMASRNESEANILKA